MTDPPYLLSDSSTLSPTASPPTCTVRSDKIVNSPRIKELVVQHTQSHTIFHSRRTPFRVPLYVGSLNPDLPPVHLHIQLAEGAPAPVSSENHITKPTITLIMSRMGVDRPNWPYFASQSHVYQYVPM